MAKRQRDEERLQIIRDLQDKYDNDTTIEDILDSEEREAKRIRYEEDRHPYRTYRATMYGYHTGNERVIEFTCHYALFDALPEKEYLFCLSEFDGEYADVFAYKDDFSDVGGDLRVKCTKIDTIGEEDDSPEFERRYTDLLSCSDLYRIQDTIDEENDEENDETE